ncbi:MAG: phenylalanine--tRNA ligase subunit beta [Propionibacteriaceae bacterium]|jgi:phenylalanyl-tRNA synthetase beta chain|nr:phenylalanine--tRNA ligase subunit beta [Propionibacteriaceae bacterium]
MRAPISWLREYAAIPAHVTGRELAELLIRAGLEVETVEAVGAELSGPIVVGQILRYVDEPQKNGKVIRWVQVDVGPEHNQPHPDFAQGCREVVCGAHNFTVGDKVVVSLPGSVLAGGFEISARKTYGHVSDGMICAEDELGIGIDHTGIIVLPAEGLEPGDDPFEYLHLHDEVLDIDVSPDMGYCLSIRGLAREAAIALDVPFIDPAQRSLGADTPAGPVAHEVVLQSPDCPLFVALKVTNINPEAPTPMWMKRRLVMAGMRSISLAVDITNYVMLEIGQPLHGYDANALTGPIVVRKALAGEQLTTLDGQLRQLHPDDLLITDDTGPIGIAGVMGGETTEMTEATTEVLIEAANFAAESIGWTLRRHNLPSEASKRFHRGVDPAAAYAAAHRAAELLVELAAGELDPAETVAGGVPVPPTQRIASDLPARILGVEVSAARAQELLEKSGVRVSGAEVFELAPPTWRPDLRDPYDYVEEVGRKLGFDTIPSVPPIAPPGHGFTRPQQLRRAVNRAAVDAGFTEVITFPFISAEDLDAMGVPADDPRRALVRLANPLAETSPYLRTTLLPGLFGAVARNTSRGNDDLALFETGSVFFAREGNPAAPLPAVDHRPSDAELAAIAAAIPTQPRHLAAILTGAWQPAGWQGEAVPASWQQAFELADQVAQAVGLQISRAAAASAPFHPGRCAALSVGDGNVVGYAGELHPSVVAALGLPARTSAVEIDLDALFAAAPGSGDIATISTHPVAKEDVALIVDADIAVAAVQTALTAGAGPLLESIALFDIYTGDQIPPGKKSLAFALRFRAPDRTLTEAEAGAARDAAIAAAQTATGAIPRV